MEKNKENFKYNHSTLCLDSINHSYNYIPCLKNISFDVNKGEIISLLGPSGVGKTTILRAIAGLDPIKNGEIFLNKKIKVKIKNKIF